MYFRTRGAVMDIVIKFRIPIRTVVIEHNYVRYRRMHDIICTAVCKCRGMGHEPRDMKMNVYVWLILCACGIISCELSTGVNAPGARGVAHCAAAGTAAPGVQRYACLLYTSPSPRDRTRSRMPSSA